MKYTVLSTLLLSSILLFFCTQKEQVGFNVPVTYHKLDNGLKVILSQDKTAPLVTVAVYYNIGFRIEPRDRTGFAHLFEHMMFQGSANLGKMEFIRLVESNGGILNGSTRFDFTNYFEIVPAHKLETMLWVEADRMRSLAITQENLTNQQGVVINEIKVNVLNQPYGGFPWLDLPQYANENWYNAHNFYGDLKDVEAATLKDVQDFFATYYAPNNAALIIVGDFDPVPALEMVIQYFGDIKSATVPDIPDLSEPQQEKEKRFSKEDKLANKPALAFAYHVPERLTPEYYAMGIIDQILLQGNDSRLYQAIVQEKGYASSIDGGINALLGDMYDYNGPMLWSASLIHDTTVAPDSIIAAIDQQIDVLLAEPIDQKTLDRALIKIRSSFYDNVGAYFGFGRANMLACFALFDDNPELINDIEDQFNKVTPELIQKTAQEYLRPGNRTILTIIPKAGRPQKGGQS
ncbi:insulinase family protein [candidate division KSB1 bacterium]|nr:insulinase family protein [candidate division KSB1 bacterium]